MKKLSLFSLFILILALGCSEDSNSPNNNSKELMPLKIGNKWVYNYTSFDNFEVKTTKGTLTVVSDEMYNGERYYIIEMSDGDQAIIPPIYYINKSDGLYMLFFEENQEPETVLIKYPVTEGEIFFNDGFHKSYVEKVDTLISTSAGKFKCIKYVDIIHLNGEQIHKSIKYYCPGIGLIASKSGNWSLDDRTELVTYTLK
ncbi:MAG: hypothetical protein CVV22_04785 [Ignavibacteriae bacterium HGW-Ignavibacteriae-1]|nr:MAG: hypothetical protein CVV22_04785 [Ignavibacteriae bacterium HGW-Ignavibacteriae-1]